MNEESRPDDEAAPNGTANPGLSVPEHAHAEGPPQVTFADMRDVLCYADGDHLAICRQRPGDQFRALVVGVADADEEVAKHAGTGCVWFSVNPTSLPVGSTARGTAEQVARLVAVWGDFDIKPGGFRNYDDVRGCINDISGIVGTRPGILVYTGNGVHAYWPLEPESTVGLSNASATALAAAFGRLVQNVAAEGYRAEDGAKVKADNVFDISRVLRVPSTANFKDPANPLPVTAYADTGAPLGVQELTERLAEVGIEPEEPDTVGTEVLSAPEGWNYNPNRTCRCVARLVEGWNADAPAARNPWMFSQQHKIAAVHRLGCFRDREEHHRALAVLQRRFHELLKTGDVRTTRKYEFSDAHRRAVERVSRMTEDRANEELDDPYHFEDVIANSAKSRSGNGSGSTPGHDASVDIGGDNEFEDDPIPLTSGTVTLPPFPVDALPREVANMVTELAEATQTDPAMAGTSALTTLSACSGGHAEIQIRSGWQEPLCINTLTNARPGERKSAVQSAMTSPLHDAEANMSIAGEIERVTLKDELELAKKKADRLASSAATAATKPGASDEERKAAEDAEKAALDAAAAVRAIKVPEVPRLLADDITPEATASLLADNGGRIAIISAEGGIFDTLAGRYARAVNIDVYLKGHSGDPIRVDRKGRPAEYIPRPALTVGLMVQPRVIEAIANNRDFVGRGLLARFLYALPVSMVGSRSPGAQPVSDNTKAQYKHVITNLAAEMAKWVGDPAVLMLSPEAEAAVLELEQKVEPMLAGDGALASPSTLTEWGSKYVGAVVRIAGLLHLGQHGAAGSRWPVQPETVKSAERIGEYFLAAAINVFSDMGSDPVTADAVYLLDRIQRLGVDEVSERDMFSACNRSRFRTKTAMAPSLARLVEHGYLIPLQAPTAPRGGRAPSPLYKVHPSAAHAAHAAKGAS